jgi:hypothetical protein
MSILGIRKDADAWTNFTSDGDHVGRFATDEAAMWGAWVTPKDAHRINIDENRPITMDDVRRSMRLYGLRHESIIGTTHEFRPHGLDAAHLVVIIAVDDTHVYYRKQCGTGDTPKIPIDDFLDQATTHWPGLRSD